MKICTMMEVWVEEYSFEESLRFIAEAGFDAADISMASARSWELLLDRSDYLEEAERIRQTAEKLGLSLLQAHAPFGHRAEDEPAVARVIRSIEVCGVMGVPRLVIHPCFGNDRRYDQKQEEYFTYNVAYYNRLRPYAEKAGVTIAIENMFVWDEQKQAIAPSIFSTAEELLDMLRVLDGPFTVCLDIGHTNLNAPQTAAEMIRRLGPDNLGCLHIHDNDGISDLHTLPMTQKIDFAPIFTALHDIGYRGCFTYEADSFLSRFPLPAYPAAARLMAVLAKEWIRQYDL